MIEIPCLVRDIDGLCRRATLVADRIGSSLIDAWTGEALVEHGKARAGGWGSADGECVELAPEGARSFYLVPVAEYVKAVA
jgi:hypothetical protein